MTDCRKLDLTHRGLCAIKGHPYYAGDDWSVVIEFADSAGDPLSLDGLSFKATIKNASTEMLRSSADSSQIEILEGGIRLRIGRAEALPASPGGTIYNIDIVRVAADLTEQTWAIGKLEAVSRVTA